VAAIIGFGFLALSATYFVVAGLLARQRHRSVFLEKSIIATVFTAVAALSTSIAYLQASRGLAFDIPYRARTFGVLALPPIVSACYQLQGRRRLARVLEIVLYVFWATIAMFSTITTRFDGGAVSLTPFVDRVGEFEQPVRLLLSLTLAWSIYVLVRTYRSTEGIGRRQVSYSLIGMGIYTFGAGALAASAVWIGRGAVDPALAYAMSIPWIGLTLYGASRYRLFDVTHLFTRSVAALVLVLGAAAAGYALHRVITPYAGGGVAAAMATGLVVVPLVSANVRSGVQATVAKVLGQRSREEDERRALDALSSTLSLDELVPTIVQIASKRLDVLSVALYLRGDDGELALADGAGLSGDPPKALEEDAAIAEWLDSHRELFIAEEQLLYGSKELAVDVHEELDPLAVEVAAPIVHGPQLEGILLVGPKRTREAFTPGELDWIHALAGRAAFAIENVHLYAALEEALADLDAFVRSAAHDLRSPLRAIDNLARFAREDLDEDPDAVPEHLAAIRRRAVRMEALLDGVERYLRIRPGASDVTHERIRLADLVRSIADKRLPETFELVLDVDAEPVLVAVEPFEVVLDELIENAVTHHDRDQGRIEVSAHVKGRLLEVAVEDDGPGVPSALQPKIFKLFQTIERRDVTEATGIGLALCKKIVSHHGGALTVTSDGRGATFEFAWRVDRK
jgi:signal transduction histidine kinase